MWKVAASTCSLPSSSRSLCCLPRCALCMCFQSGLDAGASIQALRRFNNALRAVSADNWGE